MKDEPKASAWRPCSVEGCYRKAMRSLPRLVMCAVHILRAHERACTRDFGESVEASDAIH